VTRFVCIHGHFYQPPREDPETGLLPFQPTASPFSNWNQRITDECYAKNLHARCLASGRQSFHNNYNWISHNFGPTLLGWLETEHPMVYAGIIDADRHAQERTGFGLAMAQVAHHAIIPLCNAQDKRTEIAWGIADFVHRYGRQPLGMWLSECAVDIPTLEALANAGIQFTILAPEQAGAICPPESDSWLEVNPNNLDTTRPYDISLPSGKSISVFFYHAPLARAVAFESALNDGEAFAKRIEQTVLNTPDESLTHFATDGESYGHHHRHGEMALARCLQRLRISDNEDIQLTHYAAYLSEHPAQWRAQIVQPSAWSCSHGVGRWYRNCGCVMDPKKSNQQEWRGELRHSLNKLRDQVANKYLEELGPLLHDPWKLRDRWRAADMAGNTDLLIGLEAKTALSGTQHQQIRQWMKVHEYALKMFTSCGWFFDDGEGIEPMQLRRYAKKVQKLLNDI